MSLLGKKKILVTHNGSFHADDLFATATLSILNDGNVKIIRTRDPKDMAMGDFVYDVGGEYNPEKNIFDHHQKGGAGARPNGVPYSSFGLIWKTYGEKICGDKEVAEKIDQKLIQPIDAIDNGVDVAKPIFEGVMTYSIDQAFLNDIPTWKEDKENIDDVFKKLVKKVKEFLLREIEVTKADVEGKNIIVNSYNNSSDKRIVILENDFPRYLYQNTLSLLPEPIYTIIPSGHSSLWKVEAIRKSPDTMENRKLFPESWRGFFNEDPKLKEVTGVEDATFCHKGGFLVIAGTKEGAIKLAEKALLA
ncbi:MAG TPA: MYG1 family protein [Candidatus Paceibacterota bacterium]|nr:MYG1 family protein [Candidatus Paceibacterota bacterium]